MSLSDVTTTRGLYIISSPIPKHSTTLYAAIIPKYCDYFNTNFTLTQDVVLERRKAMPREKMGYRDNLEYLGQKFPEKMLLTKKDIMDLTGLSRKSVANNFPFPGKYISIPDFARMISQ